LDLELLGHDHTSEVDHQYKETLSKDIEINKVTASFGESGLAIEFYEGDEVKKTYGELDMNHLKSWSFTENAPLVGLYGRHTLSGEIN